ncbi:hypothetical protein AGRA3207_004365 [Actinomadura graeca]|uniref:Secreted protein n=1 Tax=Actinomadura graeca TaxID=2750812 RepID=A0ABX8QWZ3_9ACTN|nr:hypothetical protein [Actinomadura graeca]QXJ23233.1 hypothetical protein AGRA3207_004365 [Actinomadura graeca]
MSKRTMGRRVAGALAVSAFAAALLPAGVAMADGEEQPPTYTCDQVAPGGEDQASGFEGTGACEVTSGELPEEGPVLGTFVISSRQAGPGGSVYCEVSRPFSGFAKLPESVQGLQCSPLER